MKYIKGIWLFISLALLVHIILLIPVTINTVEYSERLKDVKPVIINGQNYPNIVIYERITDKNRKSKLIKINTIEK